MSTKLEKLKLQAKIDSLQDHLYKIETENNLTLQANSHRDRHDHQVCKIMVPCYPELTTVSDMHSQLGV